MKEAGGRGSGRVGSTLLAPASPSLIRGRGPESSLRSKTASRIVGPRTIPLIPGVSDRTLQMARDVQLSLQVD